MVRDIRKPYALIAGTIVVAAAIVVAFAAVHGTHVTCSYLGGTPPPRCPQPASHLLLIRGGIIVGGLVIALAIYFGSQLLASRRR